MAIKTRRQHVELVSIPAQSILKERLERVLSESRRLRLLIRTARELERIEQAHVTAQTAEDRPEVTE